MSAGADNRAGARPRAWEVGGAGQWTFTASARAAFRAIFRLAGRVRIAHLAPIPARGPLIVASNHISHFDPPLLGAFFPRHVDWMAMEELFRGARWGRALALTGSFPVRRSGADHAAMRKTIATAARRLRAGRVVGIFPEGGIRAGETSILEGAPMRPGVAALALLAQAPILPCVIAGTDRFYHHANWLPFRRPPVWVLTGEPIPAPASEDRDRLHARLAAAFVDLKATLMARFRLSEHDLPRTPQARKGEDPYAPSPGPMSRRLLAHTMDAVMCAVMNHVQWSLRHDVCSREEFEAYLTAGDALTPEEYFAAPPAWPACHQLAKNIRQLTWPSPVDSGCPENDTARALWFVGPAGPAAPTALVLHALMSASDAGYRRLATWFHARGWNVVFPHLPYHYSRVPRGSRNGALAITANLPRNAQGLRQGVAEQRQLMAFLRSRGCGDFGLLGTSYGGWTASLLGFVEPRFRFLTLIQPIIDLEHAIWENPGAVSIRRILTAQGITAGQTHRHAHLTSPLHGTPLTPRDRITLIGGEYDTVAPPAGLRELAAAWAGARYAEVRQGHFGYAALEEAKRRLEPFLNGPGS